jgi:hypothetical protein
VDEGTQAYELIWPFTVKQVRRAMKAVEDEAQEIWDATHGCEGCGTAPAVNPNCKACGGHGEVI